LDLFPRYIGPTPAIGTIEEVIAEACGPRRRWVEQLGERAGPQKWLEWRRRYGRQGSGGAHLAVSVIAKLSFRRAMREGRRLV
jgi:hypothetical protein